MNISLPPLLQLAAALQLAIAALNLFLVPLLKWQPEVERMPPLLREVFYVHAWFISLTLGIFAVLTWHFAGRLAVDPLGQWLACAIGLFWGIRTILQVMYYSSSHWRGQLGRTLVHLALLVIYGGFAAVYFWTAFAGHRSAA
jgi:hypothetical protein